MSHNWEPVEAAGGAVACHGHCNLIALSPAALAVIDRDAALDLADPHGHGRRLCEHLGIDPVLPREGGSV